MSHKEEILDVIKEAISNIDVEIADCYSEDDHVRFAKSVIEALDSRGFVIMKNNIGG